MHSPAKRNADEANFNRIKKFDELKELPAARIRLVVHRGKPGGAGAPGSGGPLANVLGTAPCRESVFCGIIPGIPAGLNPGAV